MVPARAVVYLSLKPSTEDGKFRVSVLVLAWSAPKARAHQHDRYFDFVARYPLRVLHLVQLFCALLQRPEHSVKTMSCMPSNL